MANKYLSVVEDAYRASIEEQDDTAVWFTHALQKLGGAEVGILLRGNAVNYACKGQDATGLRFGTRAVTHTPEMEKDLGALIARKVPVWVVSEDATERGIGAQDLIAGVENVSRAGLAKLFDRYDRVFHW
jgi:sulfur relay (sulfurtransferase) DsrF/TusC family protein